MTSACPLDCPDACSLDVQVEDGRLVSLQGNHKNPFTQGFICGKVRDIREHIEGPDRILTPLIRSGPKGSGQFRRAGWDEALDIVANTLGGIRHAHGGESILPFCYGGSNGFLTQGGVDARFFRRLGASRLLRTFCAAPSGRAATGLYGRMPGVALPDYAHSKLIVLWGMNPSSSGIHLVPIIKEARENGAKLVVVDPRRIPLARSADLHLPIRPGTDLPVALSIIRTLFEEGHANWDFLGKHTVEHEELRRRAAAWTLERAAGVAGINAGLLREFVDLYVATNPAVIRCGWGVERSRTGGSGTAAILAIPSVAGKFGVRGGGYTMSNSGAWKLDAAAQANEPETRTREVNMSQIGEALLNPKGPRIHAMFVYNANPLATAPAQEKVRQGFLREDLFTVVHEQVMTDTAKLADVILPATTFLEHDEISRGYGGIVLHDSPATIARIGEARPNYEVFAELCRRMDLAKPGDPLDVRDLRHAVLHSDGQGGAREAQLRELGVAYPSVGPNPLPFVDSFPLTPDRKAHLCPPALDAEIPGGLYTYAPVAETPRYPLALISPASSQTISSTFGQLVKGPVPVEISPTDAATRKLRTGSRARLFNDHGEVQATVEVNPEIREGVLALPKGLWAKHTLNGRTANALIPDHVADLGGGACYNDARVEIEALPS